MNQRKEVREETKEAQIHFKATFVSGFVHFQLRLNKINFSKKRQKERKENPLKRKNQLEKKYTKSCTLIKTKKNKRLEQQDLVASAFQLRMPKERGGVDCI